MARRYNACCMTHLSYQRRVTLSTLSHCLVQEKKRGVLKNKKEKVFAWPRPKGGSFLCTLITSSSNSNYLRKHLFDLFWSYIKSRCDPPLSPHLAPLRSCIASFSAPSAIPPSSSCSYSPSLLK